MILLCLAIVGASYYALFNHQRTFRFGEPPDFVYRIESKLLDLRMQIRGPQKSAGKVGILAIDERSIRKFGRWPFSRRYYGQALKNLKELGVKWVGFDVIFSEAEKTRLEDAQKSLRSLKKHMGRKGSAKVVAGQFRTLDDLLKQSPGDRSFVSALNDFGNVVLGYMIFNNDAEVRDNLGDRDPFPGKEHWQQSFVESELPTGKTLADFPEISTGRGVVTNIPELSAASPHHGFFSNNADDDAINRWVTLVVNTNGQLQPSLALKTVAEYLNSDILAFFDDFGIENLVLVNRDNPEEAIEIPVDPRGAGRILVNHMGPGGSFRHFSLADAYENQFTEKEKKMLKGAVLLLGATASGIQDLRPNPFDPAIDGVENHAAVIENVISGRMLKRPPEIYGIELMIILGVGLLFSPLMIWGNPFLSGLATALFLPGYYYFDQFFWFGQGIWAYLAIPTGEILALFVGTTLYKYMTEEREKKQVKGAFRHYLSAEVIDQILEHPETMQPGGEKKECTVFFSDVRSFTTISETLSPERLCELMNDYFTPMTNIILESGGVLDKYIGDAVMAFWGAPVPMPDAPDVAVRASVDMLFALDVLRQEFPDKGFPVIDIGIGLNTGPMSVGNMGGSDRFTYTVMGDAVNLGSRLEGLTKEYGIKIMISEFTRNKLTDPSLFVRDLDEIRVKGKSEPVRVYDVLRPDFLTQETAIREFIGQFDEGRNLYTRQEFTKARECFTECLRMKGDDGPSHLYVKRIEEYLVRGPGDDWDGVCTFAHK